MGGRSSLPDARSCREAGGSAGGLAHTIRCGLSNINGMTIFYTTSGGLTWVVRLWSLGRILKRSEHHKTTTSGGHDDANFACKDGSRSI